MCATGPAGSAEKVQQQEQQQRYNDQRSGEKFNGKPGAESVEVVAVVSNARTQTIVVCIITQQKMIVCSRYSGQGRRKG